MSEPQGTQPAVTLTGPGAPPLAPARPAARKVRRAGRPRSGLGAAAACAVLIGLFAALGWVAVDTKCATWDEPNHAVGAWVASRYHDFRIDPENPALWLSLVALPHGRGALAAEMGGAEWEGIREDIFRRFAWSVRTLYQTRANNADAFIGRSRAVMLSLGVSLGAVIAWWGWRLGGAMAAVVATFLFAFDPNFLAHAPLVKNDVPMALAMSALAAAVWSCGRRVTLAGGVAAALACALAVNTKFSGLLCPPIMVGLLAVRAAAPGPWQVFGRAVASRGGKLLAAGGLVVAAGVVSYGVLWGSYGFRFEPAPDPAVRLNVGRILETAEANELAARHPDQPITEAQWKAWSPGPLVRFCLFVEKHRLFPQAWAFGLLFQHATTVFRSEFLLGKTSATGWWYYFPLAMLFKTPLATLAAMGVAGGAAVAAVVRRRRGGVPAGAERMSWWDGLSLASWPIVYLGVAMAGNLNLGLRHVLPVYPFVFIAVGLAAASLWRRRPRAMRWTAGVLAAALAVESVAAFPDYIPFFNAACGPYRLHLLGDSNLDWGQDLPLLADWQHKNPNAKLYLAYFGTADPAYYGIEYTNLPDGYLYGPPPALPDRPGVIALSATTMQGIYLEGVTRQRYGRFIDHKPLAVLGGSIYLYEGKKLEAVRPNPQPKPATAP